MVSTFLKGRRSLPKPTHDEVNPSTLIPKENKTDPVNFKNLLGFGPCLGFVRKCLLKLHTPKPKIQAPPTLLGPQPKHLKGRKTLILDLDETLIHSTYGGHTRHPDIVIPIRNQGVTHMIHVKKRPGVENFLARVSELFEVVVFTASLEEYAKPLVDKLDKQKKVSSLLVREACTADGNGNFTKDLSKLGRDLRNVILVDNSVRSFELQPENAYHIKDFYDDKNDRELEKLLPFLEYLANKDIVDVRPVSDHQNNFDKVQFRVKPPQANQEQVSPEKTKKKKKAAKQTRIEFKRTTKRQETEKLPLNLDPEESHEPTPEEAEALRVIRNLSMRRTLLRNHLKTIDANPMAIGINMSGGSALSGGSASTVANTPSPNEKDGSISIRTPEFGFVTKADFFSDTPKETEAEKPCEKRPSIQNQNSQRMLSQILELDEMKKPKFERFDSEVDEAERKISITPTESGLGTMQELLMNAEVTEIASEPYLDAEIKLEATASTLIRC